ncbi:MAG: hypothetical protein HY912_02130 [Desulfomonile tiedjei]|uniref:Uncharacterized protein n=1 Tax=Desulfomonile tiedjei TaxID=2358 RepID=A0A9D6UYJ2_9BACT|nr:hypothetical protein [Desulfomonile tiedjei]
MAAYCIMKILNQSMRPSMTLVQDTSVVTVLHPIFCGLDVHKKFITNCLMSSDPMGKERLEEGWVSSDALSPEGWLQE